MRVLYLTHRLPYAPNRGDRIRSFHTLRLLCERHEVDVFSLVHDDEEASHVPDVERMASSVTTSRVRSTVAAAPRALIAFATATPLTHVLLDGPGVQHSLRSVVERRRPDVVLAFCSGMVRFAMSEPLLGIPTVLDLVDVDSEKWRALASGLSLKSPIYRHEARTLATFETRAIRAARTTVVVNERERDLLLDRGIGDTVLVAPNGVDVDAFRRPADAGGRSKAVVFTAVFSYEPNAAAAVWLIRDVWPRVRAAVPDARLSLVGADPPQRMRELAAQDASVEVTGTVTDVRPYLWTSSVAVAPLRVARGVQNKVLEAAAAGLPVVTTSQVMAGLPEGIREGAIQADTEREFSAAVIDLLSGSRPVKPVEPHRFESLRWPARLSPLMQAVSDAVSPGRATS